mmetsp:Transcript_13458/g.31862  ORF Transcript_13458/g.31862 Transcript_13458/m.31862 type:complete len:221 (+) Transcript_13458:257-919(+)
MMLRAVEMWARRQWRRELHQGDGRGSNLSEHGRQAASRCESRVREEAPLPEDGEVVLQRTASTEKVEHEDGKDTSQGVTLKAHTLRKHEPVHEVVEVAVSTEPVVLNRVPKISHLLVRVVGVTERPHGGQSHGSGILRKTLTLSDGSAVVEDGDKLSSGRWVGDINPCRGEHARKDMSMMNDGTKKPAQRRGSMCRHRSTLSPAGVLGCTGATGVATRGC